MGGGGRIIYTEMARSYVRLSDLRSTRYPKKLCPVSVAAMEKLWIQLSRFLHVCIGQASNCSLRPLCESI